MVLERFAGREEEPPNGLATHTKCDFFGFSSTLVDIFARNHLPMMITNYPEAQGPVGVAGSRREPDKRSVSFFCRIRPFLGSEGSEDPDSAL